MLVNGVFKLTIILNGSNFLWINGFLGVLHKVRSSRGLYIIDYRNFEKSSVLNFRVFFKGVF